MLLESLPPTSDADPFHSQCIYHQQVWDERGFGMIGAGINTIFLGQ